VAPGDRTIAFNPADIEENDAMGNGWKDAAWVLCGLAAATSALVGFGVLFRYAGTAGAEGAAPEMWPSESRIAHDPSRANLVMLVHPECPCSRASMTELARLMTHIGSRMVAHVLFVMPPGMQGDPSASDMWEAASHIPNTSPAIDPQGTEARRLGALTSGQVVVYGGDGKLLFSGGITAARSHEGDNAGSTAVEMAALGQSDRRWWTPVFGCELFDRKETK
jgi:hypothetical protein